MVKFNNILRVLGVIFLMLSFPQCEKIGLYQDDKLHLQKEDYTGNQLRIDGYYYRVFDGTEGKRASTIFFFSNGVVLSTGVIPLSEVGNEKSFRESDYFEIWRKDKHGWGLYTINSDKIKYERWVSNSQGPLLAYTREGMIINDTTFFITKSYRMKNDKKKDEKFKHLLYHFQKFSPKPDSTNEFIE